MNHLHNLESSLELLILCLNEVKDRNVYLDLAKQTARIAQQELRAYNNRPIPDNVSYLLIKQAE